MRRRQRSHRRVDPYEHRMLDRGPPPPIMYYPPPEYPGLRRVAGRPGYMHAGVWERDPAYGPLLQPPSDYVKPDWAHRQDWYQLVPDAPVYKNPHAIKHGIKHPAFIVITGRTGSGKTQMVLDLIRVMDNFDEIHVFSPFGDKDPLYALLPKMYKGELHIYDNIAELPDVTTFADDKKKQRLFIFDDVLPLSKSIQNRIVAYNTAVRKCNGSCINLYQSYFATPLIIRNQAGYVFPMPGTDEANRKDFNLLADRYGDVNAIRAMYKECVDAGDFFWIDTMGPADQRFRCGFDRVLPYPEEFSRVASSKPHSRRRRVSPTLTTY